MRNRSKLIIRIVESDIKTAAQNPHINACKNEKEKLNSLSSIVIMIFIGVMIVPVKKSIAAKTPRSITLGVRSALYLNSRINTIKFSNVAKIATNAKTAVNVYMAPVPSIRQKPPSEPGLG